MAVLDPIIPRVLATRIIPRIDPPLAEAYGFDGLALPSVGLITCDLDDALYTALDEATKQAPVEIVFARSLYAGSGFPSGPTSGERPASAASRIASAAIPAAVIEPTEADAREPPEL